MLLSLLGVGLITFLDGSSIILHTLLLLRAMACGVRISLTVSRHRTTSLFRLAVYVTLSEIIRLAVRRRLPVLRNMMQVRFVLLLRYY